MRNVSRGCGSAVFACLVGLASIPASGQVVFDGTVGPAGLAPGAPHYQIPSSVGKPVGGNLFHSFSFFSVPGGGSATFSQNSPGNFSNIIGRVTGGFPSSIDGALRSTISGANLFLINPSGMMFGPNASLSISGSFHASTANYLKLGTDGRFDATNAAANVLTAAPPSAFGFVAGPINPIVLNGSRIQFLAPGNGLSLVGGNIGFNNAQLSVGGGSVDLVSVAGPGEVGLSAGGPTLAPSVARGTILLQNGSLVGTVSLAPGLPPGRVVIRGGDLTLVDSQVRSDTAASVPAPSIEVDVTREVRLERASIASEGFGSGAAAAVVVNAVRVALAGGSDISSSVDNGAPAATGDVMVRAVESLRMSSGSAIGSVSTGPGGAGDVSIAAPLIELDGSQIVTVALGTGPSGSISLSANRVVLSERSPVLVRSDSGNAAGRLEVAATDSITISRSDAAFSPALESGLFSTTIGNGRGGDIAVRTPLLELRDGVISAQTQGRGAAGNVTLDVGRLNLTRGSRVDVGTFAQGPGGTLSVNASESFTASGLNVSGRASALTAFTFGSGAGGEVIVRTPDVRLSDSGRILADAFVLGGPGRIAVDADRILVTTLGQISSSSAAPVGGGVVTVTARERVDVTNTGSIFGTALAGGRGSSVFISAPLINLDGGGISTRSSAAGAAGDITLDAERVVVIGRAQLNSNAEGSGAAGKLMVTASESVSIVAPGEGVPSGFFSRTVKSAPGGDIRISAPDITVDGGAVRADTAGTGAAGSVALDGMRVSIINGSQLDSSTSAAGNAGIVTVTARESLAVSGRSSRQASQIITATAGSGQGGRVVLNAPLITIDGGFVSGESRADGPAGNIAIDASRVIVRDGGQVRSSAKGSGAGGRLNVTALQSLEIVDDVASGNTGLFAVTEGAGRGGEIVVNAPAVAITGGSISTSASSVGRAGRITIDAQRLSLARGAQIDSSTAASGDGGTLVITATELVSLMGDAAAGRQTNITASSAGRGRAGEITVSAPRIEAANGFIAAQAFAEGAAGVITIAGGRLVLRDGAQVSSTTQGSGAGGTVNVIATETVEVTSPSAAVGGAGLFGSTQGSGRGGDVVVRAPLVMLSGGRVNSTTSGSGVAGNVDVSGDRIVLASGGTIDSSSRGGSGDAGTVRVAATRSVQISGRDVNGVASNISGRTDGPGAGGSIAIGAATLTLSDGAEISTSSSGAGRGGAISVSTSEAVTLGGDSSVTASSTASGDAGNIAIDAGRSLVMNGSSITTEARTADGGNIDIKAIELVRLTNSRITTSVGTGFGNGGNINIDPIFVVLDGSQITANAFGGNGGNINIVTNALLQSGNSIIEASSELGIQGTIQISAPESDLTGGLAALPSSLFDPSLLLRESCSARAARGGNSFVGVGYGGLPDRPGSLAFSSYAERPTGSTAAARLPLFALTQAFEGACF